MKPQNDLRQADDAAAIAQHDPSDLSASASDVLADVEKDGDSSLERVRTVTGFKVGEMVYEAYGYGTRLTELPLSLVVSFPL